MEGARVDLQSVQEALCRGHAHHCKDSHVETRGLCSGKRRTWRFDWRWRLYPLVSERGRISWDFLCTSLREHKPIVGQMARGRENIHTHVSILNASVNVIFKRHTLHTSQSLLVRGWGPISENHVLEGSQPYSEKHVEQLWPNARRSLVLAVKACYRKPYHLRPPGWVSNKVVTRALGRRSLHGFGAVIEQSLKPPQLTWCNSWQNCSFHRSVQPMALPFLSSCIFSFLSWRQEGHLDRNCWYLHLDLTVCRISSSAAAKVRAHGQG